MLSCWLLVLFGLAAGAVPGAIIAMVLWSALVVASDVDDRIEATGKKLNGTPCN